MSNFKLIKTAAALALGASVVTSAIVPADASAASKYKVKNGKLVIAKTGKKATGTVTFNKIVYKNGVKLTGLKSKVYYKAGKKATGTYKGAYYVKGAKKATTGLYAKKYYKAGKVATGTYKSVYYVKGVVATGVYNKTYYKAGKVATGTYKSVYYVKGKAANGTYNKAFYVAGKSVATTGLYKNQLYVAGKVNTGLTVFEDKLYNGAVLNTGAVKFGDRIYNGSVENTALLLVGGVFYNGSTLATGDIEGVTYINGVKQLAKFESATAINATELTVAVTLDKEVAEADLKDTKITLTGAQTLTATFVKVEGKVATYKVDTDIKGKTAYDGEYAITSSVVTGDIKTTYSAVIAGTFVEGFVKTTKSSKLVSVSDATVTVDGKTTKTDANGYYQLAVNPGLKTVEISKGNDYFVQEADANVSRNFSTVINKDITAVNVDQLVYTGTILDAKDSSAVAGVDVQLQEKNDKGEWTNVTDYKVETDATGKFAFGNFDVDTATKAGVVATTNFKSATASKGNKLAVGTEYRVVAEKAVKEDNLDLVYKQQTATFTVSNKKAQTTSLLKVEKVAELQELNLDLTWLKDSVVNDTVSVEILNTDGKEVLENFDLVKDTDFTLNDAKNGFKEAVEVVSGKAKFANGTSTTTVKPRLVSGTYFAVVTNGTENAKKAFAIEVTEGGKAKVKFEVEQAKTAQAKTIVDKVQYANSLYLDPKLTVGFQTSPALELTQIDKNLVRETTKPITAKYEAYQTVAGKDIFIANSVAAPVKATATSATKVDSIAAADVALDQLAASVTYKVKSASDFLVGNKELTVKPDAATNNVSATVDATTKLASIKLTDKTTKDALKGYTKSAGTDEYAVVKSVKLVNEQGTTVVEVAPNEEVKLNQTAKVTTGTVADGYSIIDFAEFSDEIEAKFAGIKAGKYKVTIELDGFKSATSLETELIDFQNGEIKADTEALKGTEVTGYVRYATTGENVANIDSDAEASIIAYDVNGDVAAATNFGTNTTAVESTYSLTGLTAGKEYTFVVRGTGFETQAVKKTVVAEDLTNLNFDVVKGGKGKFNLQIVDTENVKMDNTDLAYTVKDAYYDVDNGTADKSITVPSTIKFQGQYDVTKPTTSATGTDARAYSVENVSAGSYVLDIAETTGKVGTTKYKLPQNYNLALKDVNGTSYATSTGVEIIKVPLKDSSTALEVNIDLTIAGTAADNNTSIAGQMDIDYIQVIDADGNIVGEEQRASFADVAGADPTIKLSVENNKTYTIKAYLNNGYVSSVIVPVQNYDAKATINVTQATR